MPAAPAKALPTANIRDNRIVTLSKLVLQSAFQPIAEASTGVVFGYDSLMRGFDRLGLPSPLALLEPSERFGHSKAPAQCFWSAAIAAAIWCKAMSSRVHRQISSNCSRPAPI